ncbi:signal recognition particle protein [archaeon CG10_big_fil_rev_8_21_14_0_10_43_11]|nr:MAG: signal recognition particle protein [archaeon CG10_big_fil_rev_8_21_14_0_10_43_11]
MLGDLSSSLKDTLKKIATLDFLSDKELNEIIRELQRALLRADVSFEVVTQLSQTIRTKLSKDATSLTKKQRLITLIYDEIVSFMGQGEQEVNVTKKPYKIMLIGLFGSGKTTTAGKLSKIFKSKGYRVAAVSLDNYRPAAYEQLAQLSKQINVDCYGTKNAKKQLAPWKDNEKAILNHDVVIIDTAGRDSLHKDFLVELEELSKKIKPDQVFLTIPAELGQAASELTKNFMNAIPITGIIITKLDTSAKGGGALTSSYLTKTPVVYITVGESVTDIEAFKPKRFVSRLLGMGDIETLLEKVQEELGTDDAKDLSKKILSGKSNFLDFYEQIQSINKMGGFSKIMSMMPSLPGLSMDNAMFSASKDKLSEFRIILQSMTREELENPRLINSSRIKRIARGCGRDEKDVRELIKNHARMNKFSKKLNTRQLQRMMKQFGGGAL